MKRTVKENAKKAAKDVPADRKKPLTKRQRQQRREDRRRTIVGLLLITLTLTFVAGGYLYTYRKAEFRSLLGLSQDNSDPVAIAKQKVAADKVFRTYLTHMAAANHLEVSATGTAEGSTTEQTEQDVYDVNGKRIDSTLEMQCSTQPNHGGVRLNLSGQSQGAAAYLHINSLNGVYVDASGKPVNAASLAPSSRGAWYRMPTPDTDALTQAQLDSGVFVLPVGVLAASHDAQKVADAMISNQAFEYDSNPPGKDGIYTFMVRTHKDEYTAAVTQAFPALRNPDKIVEQLFTDANEIATINTTIRVKTDGTLVGWSTTAPDLCMTMLANITGTHASGALLGETATVKPAGSVAIQPVSASSDGSITPFLQLIGPRQ